MTRVGVCVPITDDRSQFIFANRYPISWQVPRPKAASSLADIQATYRNIRNKILPVSRQSGRATTYDQVYKVAAGIPLRRLRLSTR